MGRAYYNEIDPACAAILQQCIAHGVIAPGDVDTRSIKDVKPDDLRGYTQCHFFAGGGLWSVAARLAGWPDNRPLWTGSCPCQPFSVAGKGTGIDDPRHLWPDFFRLISACRPAVVVGEQVAGSAGYGWFDGVCSDLARENYACRAVDIPACSVDAPHIRQRLYWCAVADASGSSIGGYSGDPRGEAGARQGAARQADGNAAEHSDGACAQRNDDPCIDMLANIDSSGRTGRAENAQRSTLGRDAAERPDGGTVEYAAGERRGEGRPEPIIRSGRPAIASADAQSDVDHSDGIGESGNDEEALRGRQSGRPERAYGRNGTHWSGAEWIICHDSKARRVEPSIRLLVDGLPGRVGLWRVGGNAIVPQLAAQVLGALKDDINCREAA